MAHANKILEEALSLTAAERARVAARLIESLDDENQADAEDAWRAEVARRVRDLDDGAVLAIDWLEARRQILG
ncbi:MAG: addiction module protein [Myxococcales bacterium]|nr:addiction module protein [Myxococcales bacterium]